MPRMLHTKASLKTHPSDQTSVLCLTNIRLLSFASVARLASGAPVKVISNNRTEWALGQLSHRTQLFHMFQHLGQWRLLCISGSG